jgi:hypothetical protein
MKFIIQEVRESEGGKVMGGGKRRGGGRGQEKAIEATGHDRRGGVRL